MTNRSMNPKLTACWDGYRSERGRALGSHASTLVGIVGGVGNSTADQARDTGNVVLELSGNRDRLARSQRDEDSTVRWENSTRFVSFVIQDGHKNFRVGIAGAIGDGDDGRLGAGRNIPFMPVCPDGKEIPSGSDVSPKVTVIVSSCSTTVSALMSTGR